MNSTSVHYVKALLLVCVLASVWVSCDKEENPEVTPNINEQESPIVDAKGTIEFPDGLINNIDSNAQTVFGYAMQTRDIVEQTSNRLDIPETATFSPGKTNASWSWQYVEQGDTNQVTYNFEETNNRFEYESTYERNGGIVFSIEGWHPYDRSQCYAATYVTLAENSMTLHFVINVDGSYSVDTRILFNELETVRYSAIFRPDLSGEIKVYVQGRSTPYIHGSWTASGSGESVYYDSQGIETESHIWN